MNSNFIITFGQEHLHRVNGKVIDKDCVVSITAINMLEARTKAFELFGDKWCFCYEEGDFIYKGSIKYFPRGVIKL